MPMPSPPTLEEPLSPEEVQRQLDAHFGHLKATAPRPDPPIESPRQADLSAEELQQRLNELFAGIPSRPEPTPSPRRPDPSTPEELQQRFERGIWLYARIARRRPARRAASVATRESRTCSSSARTASGSLATSFAKAGRWRTGVAGCMAALRPVRGLRRARRASSLRWSRGGASGLSGDAPKGRNSLRVASAVRDG